MHPYHEGMVDLFHHLDQAPVRREAAGKKPHLAQRLPIVVVKFKPMAML